MKCYFLTTNAFKIAESEHYLEWRGRRDPRVVEICPVLEDIQEILHPDIERIVHFKAVGAFKHIGHPCLVEHSGLFMDALPGLPGGVGKLVWDAVQDRMCDFLRVGDSRAATARSYLAYCDGRRVWIHKGETRGTIADRARGAYQFAWDPIFIPADDTRTYGEMGLEGKRHTSPMFKAWDAFFAQQVPQGKKA